MAALSGFIKMPLVRNPQLRTNMIFQYALTKQHIQEQSSANMLAIYEGQVSAIFWF
jgi:hypothetical protein